MDLQKLVRKHHGYEQPNGVAAAFAQVHRADVGALLKRSVLNKCRAQQFNTSAVMPSLPEDASPRV